MKQIWLDETGASTAEYAILTLAAVGFAGLLLTILKSPEVRAMLLDLIKSALTVSGNT
jgi:Flp pilus assembly pilin Flp